MFEYPVRVQKQREGGYVVLFPDIPEAMTQGETVEDALAHAVDALETALSLYIDARMPLPTPSQHVRRRTVRPSALECAKLALYCEMMAQGIRKSELARRLGWHVPQVDRLFNLRHASRLDQIEAAVHALGKRMEVRLL